jgi:hypothetical protein
MSKRPSEGAERLRSDNTIGQGCILQRLFSTFPNSWPGVGLLLLRLSLAITLLYLAISRVSDPSDTIVLAQNLVSAVVSIFLLAGLWTPLAGALLALIEFWIAFSRYSSAGEEAWTHIFLAIQAVSVTMLGPGAWSIDARLFGRKRFDIDGTRGRKLSLK